jgi:hypothetical protein
LATNHPDCQPKNLLMATLVELSLHRAIAMTAAVEHCRQIRDRLVGRVTQKPQIIGCRTHCSWQALKMLQESASATYCYELDTWSEIITLGIHLGAVLTANSPVASVAKKKTRMTPHAIGSI